METQPAITVKFFGMLAEITGCAQTEFPHVHDSGLLLREVYHRYPVLQDMHFSMAINRKIADRNEPLSYGDLVALLPPFSGG